MMILGDKRQEMINALNMNESLKRLTSGEFVHEELEFVCFKLRYSLELDDFSLNGIDIVPLWESDSSITGFYLDQKKPIFIHYYIEDTDEYKILGKDIIDLVNFLVEEYVDYAFEDEVRNLLLS